MKLVIKGDPITKKNHQMIIRYKVNGKYRTGIKQSKKYQDYEATFIAQVIDAGMYNINLEDKYNVKCVYYMRTRRIVDLTNLLNSTLDCLVRAKVIKDDNSRIVYSHDGSRVLYDKENPRVEVEITKIEESEEADELLQS